MDDHDAVPHSRSPCVGAQTVLLYWLTVITVVPKGELKRRLNKEDLGKRIVELKTSDKTTDKQIVQVVRGHFNQKGLRRASEGLGQ